MARMHPAVFPHDLRRRPRRAGEALVYGALAAALSDEWAVFYDRRVMGTRRRIDFLCLHPARGVLAIEVKGGMVHARRGAFRQVISANGQRKRIDPFGQLNRAVGDVWAAAGLLPDALPLHRCVWLPQMYQAGLPWQATAHILTCETLATAVLVAVVEAALPATGSAVVRDLVERLRQVLTAKRRRGVDVGAAFRRALRGILYRRRRRRQLFARAPVHTCTCAQGFGLSAAAMLRRVANSSSRAWKALR